MAEATVTKETVEIAEKVVDTPAPAPQPTRDDLKGKGWTAAEIESAEKRGMVAAAEAKTDDKKAPEEKAAPVAEKKPEAKPAPAHRGTPLDDVTLTPEQEKVFADAFGTGTPVRAMYFRAKNERHARQRAEQERDRERDLRVSLETKLAEAMKAPAKTDDPDGDPEEKPLTVKQLKEMRAKEAEEANARSKDNQSRAVKVNEAQVAQEEYVRSVHKDFDSTVELAKEVMQNLDAVLPEKWQQAKALKLIHDLQVAAANADQMDLDDFNAAQIAYELGRLHPNHGKSVEKKEEAKPGAEKDPKANGGHTPEEIKRMEQNAQRRPSSASVPAGSGRRTVAADEVSLADLNAMSTSERLKFREKHPERYTKLLRG